MFQGNLFIVQSLLLRRGGRRFDHHIAYHEECGNDRYSHQSGKSFGLAALPTSHGVKFLLPVRNGFLTRSVNSNCLKRECVRVASCSKVLVSAWDISPLM